MGFRFGGTKIVGAMFVVVLAVAMAVVLAHLYPRRKWLLGLMVGAAAEVVLVWGLAVNATYWQAFIVTLLIIIPVGLAAAIFTVARWALSRH
jgi:hypothetical protein